MNTRDTISRASIDSVFRDQQLESALWQRRMSFTLTVMMLAATAAYAGYCWFAEARWPDVSFVPALLGFIVFSHAHTRVLTLEGLHPQHSSQPSMPTCGNET